MKDFAGSSITYYGLAREKVMNKYPRLISVLVILALICMTGLVIFLISDLVSFASNPDHNGVLAGLDIKGPENDIVSMTDGKEKGRNLIGANSSQPLENLSLQTKETNSAKISKNNATQSSSQAAKGVIATGKSSSSSSSVKKHQSSSSSSSSSSAKSAKKSNDKNNLNSSEGNESEIANATGSIGRSISEGLHPADATEGLIERSNDSESQPKADLASLSSVAISSITNPAKDSLAGNPVAIIQFKTDAPSSPKSEPGQNSDNQANTDGTTVDTSALPDFGGLESRPVADNSNLAQSSKDSVKNPNSQATGTKKASPQKSKVTASSQAQKIKESRAKLAANRNQMAEDMKKKKAAQSRAKAAKK
ncbi:MAG: hypothetical protein JW999_12280 [Methanotrichaceae archaeon]|nr:hypothetical protein [Methanotrichaceae archaeon]